MHAAVGRQPNLLHKALLFSIGKCAARIDLFWAARSADVREAWNECIWFVDHATTKVCKLFVKWWICIGVWDNDRRVGFIGDSDRFWAVRSHETRCRMPNGTLHTLQNQSSTEEKSAQRRKNQLKKRRKISSTQEKNRSTEITFALRCAIHVSDGRVCRSDSVLVWEFEDFAAVRTYSFNLWAIYDRLREQSVDNSPEEILLLNIFWNN